MQDKSATVKHYQQQAAEAAQLDETVDLTVHVPKNTWLTLVEYSQECKHDTVAKTVLMMLYPTLEAFLHGKGAGVGVGSRVASESFAKVIDAMMTPKQS